MKISYDSHIKLGLERIKKALELLELKHNEFNSILVAGTNGKGTTAFYIEKIIKKHGFKTALFTSPHLEHVGERLLICGKETEEKRIENTFKEIRRFLSAKKIETTPFETLTLSVLKIAQEEDIEWFIAEVGMGGRLDATNILNATISVITTVSLDHTEYLGKTLKEIAREKAGIIKENRCTVAGKIPGEALDIIKKTAKDKRNKLFVVGKDFTYYILKKNKENCIFSWNFEDESLSLSIPSPFEFIIHNASLSLAASKLSLGKLDESATSRALREKPPRARAEIIKYNNTFVIIDVAHNPEGLKTLLEEVRTVYNPEKFLIFLSPLKDKDYASMIEIALNHGKLYLVKQNTERGIDEREVKHRNWVGVEEMKRIVKEENPDLVVVAGSFWMAKTARRFLTCQL